MKHVMAILGVAIIAVAVYLWGINLIDTSEWVKPKPDYIGVISVQPDFDNTIRSW